MVLLLIKEGFRLRSGNPVILKNVFFAYLYWTNAAIGKGEALASPS